MAHEYDLDMDINTAEKNLEIAQKFGSIKETAKWLKIIKLIKAKNEAVI